MTTAQAVRAVESAPLVGAPNKRPSLWTRALQRWQLYVLLLPALVYVAIFKYWPMYGVQIAFRNYNPVDGFSGSPFVGLANFSRFMNSYLFSRLLENTLSLAVLGLVFAFPVPIILALLVNNLMNERFKKFVQSVLYAPAFISTVVVVGMLFILLSPRSGLINNGIKLFGGDPVFFMGNPDLFRPIYVISDIWQNAGFSMVVYLAALTGVDPSLHEAAKVDGANKWQRVRHIDLPSIMPIIIVLFILAVGNLLNVGFEKALLMQTDLNMQTSEIINTYVYHIGLKQAQFSYSAAIGLFNSILNLAMLLTFNWVAKKATKTSVW